MTCVAGSAKRGLHRREQLPQLVVREGEAAHAAHALRELGQRHRREPLGLPAAEERAHLTLLLLQCAQQPWRHTGR